MTSSGSIRPAGKISALLPAVLVLLVALAWSGSWRAPFELDDDSSIRDNPTIRSLGSSAWSPPGGRGETVGGRPFLNYSFAVNYALSGVNVAAFRITNVMIHAAAALLLFGIVRRLAGGSPAAPWLAGGTATIWALHPLQTEAVTYIVQRAESLMALCYLATLYGFVRAARPAGSRGSSGAEWSRGWATFSVIACALGMATKENMVSAPLAVLLIDRAFIAGSFGAALRRRKGWYLALFGTWLVLLALFVATGGQRGGSAGFGTAVRPLDYWLTQFPAFLLYAKLSLWPHPLVFEYGPTWTAVSLGVALSGLVVLAGLAAVILGLARNRVWAAIAAIAIMVLAPTSIIPGTLQTIVEHRMYLPLAAIALGLAWFVVRTCGARGQATFALLAAIVLACGTLTYARNRVYGSELRLWADTVAKRPNNPRARNNLGIALRAAGRTDEALAEFQQALKLDPQHAFAHTNVGQLLLQRGDVVGATAAFQRSIAIDPSLASAHLGLGLCQVAAGHSATAEAEFRAALQSDPANSDAAINLASVLIERGAVDEAVALLNPVALARPEAPDVHLELGRAAEARGDARRAEAEYREAMRLDPAGFGGPLRLGNLMAAQGSLTEAEAYLRTAAAREPASPEAHYALGNVLAQKEAFASAIPEFEHALRLRPSLLEARANLGNCLLATGRVADAIAAYEAVLRSRPDDECVRRNLALARQLSGSR
jgi:Flp pilus assembly protein TadD